MLREEYLEEFKKINQEQYELTKKKNSDYANDGDAFLNFKLISIITGGKTTIEDGLLTRITDKVSRIGRLVHKKAHIEDEKIEDTLIDLANYAIIYIIYLRNKKNES